MLAAVPSVSGEIYLFLLVRFVLVCVNSNVTCTLYHEFTGRSDTPSPMAEQTPPKRVSLATKAFSSMDSRLVKILSVGSFSLHLLPLRLPLVRTIISNDCLIQLLKATISHPSLPK